MNTTEATPNRHVVSALLVDRPGAVDRAVGLVRKRRIRIDSLAMGRTEEHGLVRLTLVFRGSDAEAERLRLLLDKLIDVRTTGNLDTQPHVRRDLALVKVQANPEQRAVIHQLCQMFRAQVVDVGPTSVIVEITGDDGKIEGLLALLRPYGIVELARSGTAVLGRSEHSLTTRPHHPRACVPNTPED